MFPLQRYTPSIQRSMETYRFRYWRLRSSNMDDWEWLGCRGYVEGFGDYYEESVCWEYGESDGGFASLG